MSEAKIALSVEDQRLLDKALMRSTQHAYDIPPPPAAMPSEEERRMAVYLGLNPNAPETWPVETINRLSRIHTEEGSEAFHREVAKLMTPPIDSPFNACCYREHCKALEARALAAEAALAAERERCAQIAYRVCAETRHVTLGDKAAAAIRAQGE